MPHVIEIFSGGCALCQETVEIVSVGKCKDCQLIIHNVGNPSEEVKDSMTAYGVTSVPTIIIDGKIRVVGRPKFPWFCSDDFYDTLEKNYPLTLQIERSPR